MLALFLNPTVIIVIAMFVAFFAINSEYAYLFVLCFSALYGSIFMLGWRRAPPVLIWIVGINLLTLLADVAILELSMAGYLLLPIERFLPEAIYNSLIAVFFLAAGMSVYRIGADSRSAPQIATQSKMPQLIQCSPSMVFKVYLLSLPAIAVISRTGILIPGLTQPVLAIGLIKYVLIYILAARVFEANSSYIYLIVVIILEIALGSTGGFSSYKESFYVVLIALAWSNRTFSLRALALTLVGIACMIYMSIVWTGIKNEFRSTILSSDSLSNFHWLFEKYLTADIDAESSSIKLLERAAYASFYGRILERDTSEHSGIYFRALQSTLMPRILFPDKAVLDDSAETSKILGWNIGKGTSIGIGYVAQAHIDFGFPGLIAPIFILGALVGLIYRYFMTRSAPIFLCQAFATATLFNAIAFATNINKLLGGIVMGSLVMAMIFRYATPLLLPIICKKQSVLPQLGRGAMIDKRKSPAGF